MCAKSASFSLPSLGILQEGLAAEQHAARVRVLLLLLPAHPLHAHGLRGQAQELIFHIASVQETGRHAAVQAADDAAQAPTKTTRMSVNITNQNATSRETLTGQR